VAWSASPKSRWQSLAVIQKSSDRFGYAVVAAMIIGFVGNLWGCTSSIIQGIAIVLAVPAVVLRIHEKNLRAKANAEAMQESAEALQKIKDDVTGRWPTQEQWKRFKERLATIPPQVVSVLCLDTDAEAGQFAQLIADVLREANWRANGPKRVEKTKRWSKASIAILTAKKYEVPEWVKVLRAAFLDIGCTPEMGWDPDNIHDGAPEIYVGAKPAQE